MMLIKDPSLRSRYSHPILVKIEEEIDDHRDENGNKISENDFYKIISKFHNEVPENEQQLLKELAFENFIYQEPETSNSFVDNEEQFEAADERSFPGYKTILNQLEKCSDELWDAYDTDLHEFCKELCDNILIQEKVIEVGTKIVMHQISFNEETNECMRATFFVLKTLVPYKSNSKFQNSVKRAEFWLQELSMA
tara:strand:- start:2765 stop:3349 length:585 start_codon:yes stop_codon:yes gene_type:complete